MIASTGQPSICVAREQEIMNSGHAVALESERYEICGGLEAHVAIEHQHGGPAIDYAGRIRPLFRRSGIARP